MTTDRRASQHVWTLSWEEKDGKTVYAFRPDDPIVRQTAARKDQQKDQQRQFSSTPRTDMAEMRALLRELGSLGA